MSETNLSKATVTDMSNRVDDYEVDTLSTDGPGDQKETTWITTDFEQYLGYYKTIPELKKAIDTYATWVLGKGWNVYFDNESNEILENIKGWGEDSLISILWNMLVIKKVNGDAYAEIIRDKETQTLINLKPLDPSKIRHVVDEKGIIKRYEQIAKNGGKAERKFKPEEIFHLCNDRIADEIHGVSVIESCEWVILARNEAMSDWKKVLHRNVVPVRIIEVDEDDPTKLSALKTQYEDVINKGEVILVPKGNVEIKDYAPSLQDSMSWIQYLEGFFYQAVGVPKAVMGGTDTTEAGAKVGLLSFDPQYLREVTELQDDIWNQLAIRLSFIKQNSLMDSMTSSENKNTGQVGFQPKDSQATVSRE